MRFLRKFGILCCAVIFLQGCGVHLPLSELPRKDWLDEKVKEEEVVSIKYDLNKKLTYHDLVYLAIQNSPALAKSAINLEIQQIALSNARWNALPQLSLIYTVSNNITRYNTAKAKENKQAFKDYGETGYQLSFAGHWNNPVATYFDIQAQKELMSIALATHKQVITEYIQRIGNMLIQMRSWEKRLQQQEANADIAQKRLKHMETSTKYHVQLHDNVGLRENDVKDSELAIVTARMELASLKNQLKTMCGIPRGHKLQVDTASVVDVLNGFDPAKYTWEKCWEASTERYLLHQNVRLHNAGIYLALAQYVPTISFVINENPPNGQAQPSNAQTDQFAHVTFTFPILDWGTRYRNSAQSRARKRQSQLDEITRRQEYRDAWYSMEEQLTLAKARLQQREHALESANLRLKAMTTAHNHGTASLNDVLGVQQAMHHAQGALADAEAQVLTQRLHWMKQSQQLQELFLESPIRQVANEK